MLLILNILVVFDGIHKMRCWDCCGRRVEIPIQGSDCETGCVRWQSDPKATKIDEVLLTVSLIGLRELNTKHSLAGSTFSQRMISGEKQLESV
jgi:hypothetical protein